MKQTLEERIKRVGFATGSRADYGIMRRFLNLLENDKKIALEILATGALLDKMYDRPVELIYQDGFNVAAEIPLFLDSSSDEKILCTMSEALYKFAVYFAKNKYDLLMILGDRYEMLSVAIAAAMQKIPILHIHGGEATYGNYDEFIRHSITKMSQYHFTVTQAYQRRVIQLGENPGNVFFLGALGAENCMFLEEEKVPDTVINLKKKEYFVILFHPETLTGADTAAQTKELLAALKQFPKYHTVFLGTNADTNSNTIRKLVTEFVNSYKNAVYFENLHTDAYHYLLANSICLIGNSSSGIIEAPSLGVYTINLGIRQKGRVRGDSVIDVEWSSEAIKTAMDNVLNIYQKIRPKNPYYQENSAQNYYKTTKQLLERAEKDMQKPKEFYDL